MENASLLRDATKKKASEAAEILVEIRCSRIHIAMQVGYDHVRETATYTIH